MWHLKKKEPRAQRWVTSGEKRTLGAKGRSRDDAATDKTFALIDKKMAKSLMAWTGKSKGCEKGST